MNLPHLPFLCPFPFTFPSLLFLHQSPFLRLPPLFRILVCTYANDGSIVLKKRHSATTAASSLNAINASHPGRGTCTAWIYRSRIGRHAPVPLLSHISILFHPDPLLCSASSEEKKRKEKDFHDLYHPVPESKSDIYMSHPPGSEWAP